jgi:arylsulfatase A-like enzyme
MLDFFSARYVFARATRAKCRIVASRVLDFKASLTDKAIAWVQQQKVLMPDKPFIVYYAPGATHAPHQVPEEWVDHHLGPARHRPDDHDHLITPADQWRVAMARQ